MRYLSSPKDAILTHNHPRDPKYSVGMAGDIGMPFSANDIKNAINYDLREIRAVTPHYTFSLRRPSGGWGISASAAAEQWFKSVGTFNNEHRGYVNNPSEKSIRFSRNMRVNVIGQHDAIRKLAKKYGWEYARKKNKMITLQKKIMEKVEIIEAINKILKHHGLVFDEDFTEEEQESLISEYLRKKNRPKNILIFGGMLEWSRLSFRGFEKREKEREKREQQKTQQNNEQTDSD